MPAEDADALRALALRADVPAATLLAALADRIAALLRDDPDRLRQALYRIDVSEGAARTAAGAAEPTVALAQLVIARVRAAAAARAAHGAAPPVDDADLAW